MPSGFTLSHLIPTTIACNGIFFLFLTDEENDDAHVQRNGVT